MVALPLLEIGVRFFLDSGVRGSGPIVQHLTLWVAFLGAALAARDDKLLSFATGRLLPEGKIRDAARAFSFSMAAAVTALLCRAGVELVWIERDSGAEVTRGLPVWVAELVLPVSFAMIALRLVRNSGTTFWTRLPATIGLLVGVLIGQYSSLLDGRPAWPALTIVLLGTLAGGPIFALLGGSAVLLFLHDGIPGAAVLAETYRLTVSPTLPAVPLFTLVGFLLAEGGASHRLLRLFRAWFGWIPGGTAVVCTVVCAFFTVFTGGSGVTILALGALLLMALREDGYRDSYSVGLLTASGSLGLLFAPALPLILYGIVARISIEDLFIGGALPGVLLVGLVAGWGVREGLIRKMPRTPFNAREARAALWQAKWELALPAVALFAIFSGLATLVEAAAVTVLATLVSQAVVHRDLTFRRGVPKVLVECVVLIGGVLLIMGVAMGLTNYMVDAQIPSIALSWVQQHIESPLVFLLRLNLFLLLVGCVMDIFSATVVVVPLIVPIGAAFGIDPVHLGIIFVANLELGYLTPPVGLNLFLASYRFERPLLMVYRAAVPFLLILAFGVLLITYFPPLTTGLLRLLGR